MLNNSINIPQSDKENIKVPKIDEPPLKVFKEAKCDTQSPLRKLGEQFKDKYSPSRSAKKSDANKARPSAKNLLKDFTEVDFEKEREGNFPHNSYSFLKPKNIKDKHLNGKDHSDYDPKTLYVPPNFIKSLTPVILIFLFRISY